MPLTDKATIVSQKAARLAISCVRDLLPALPAQLDDARQKTVRARA